MKFMRNLSFFALLAISFATSMVFCPYDYDEDGNQVWIGGHSHKQSGVVSRLKQQEFIRKEAARYANRLRAVDDLLRVLSTLGDKRAAIDALLEKKDQDKEYSDALAVAYSCIANASDVKQDEIDKITEYKNWCRESELALSSYDSMGNEMLRVFVGPQSSVYASTWYGKIGYAIIVPALNAWGRAFDKELESASTSFMKRASRMARVFFAQMGFISPLSTEQVSSWIRALEKYRASMDKLSSSSAQDSSFANTFAQRNASKVEKGLLGAKESAKDSVVDLDSAAKGVALLNPVKAYAMRSIPAHVTITESVTMLLRSQLSDVVQSIDVSYSDQRLLINESLKMLDEINLMIQASFYENNELVLTQKVKNSLLAQCDHVISSLDWLCDILNSNKDTSSPEPKSSPARSSRNNRLLGD
ncbi:hypothetical protein FJ366_00200 [Candidatus Dependentiae bacterium]|nr:hypothetical protein [Candidatus Dependentiae bacterium]